MEEKKNVELDVPFSIKVLAVGLIFGVIALIIVVAGIHFPIPGTDVVTDPRESFTTFGSALSGPIGGIIIGILAGIAEPGGIALASLLAHISGALWTGFIYKKIIYKQSNVLFMLLGWIIAVLIYYYVFAISGFAIGLVFFYGEQTPILQLYLDLAKGVIFELLLTIFITTSILYALPRRYRKPLW